MRALALLTVLTVTVATVAPAAAEEPAPPQPSRAEVQERIAVVLYERGVKLYDAEMWADAKALFQESLARSPDGPKASAAKDMIRRCEAALAAPPSSSTPPDDEPEEPDEPHPGARPPAAEDQPLDPYAEDARPRRRTFRRAARQWLAPTVLPAFASPVVDRGSQQRRAKNLLLVFGGSYGAVVGYLTYVAIGDKTGGVAAPLVFSSAAIGITGAWLVARGRNVRDGDALVTMSAATWVGLLAAAVANMADDPSLCATCLPGSEDVSNTVYHGSAAIGSALGLAGGILFARRYHPSAGDVALTNSFIAYGMTVGLFAGVIMQPSQERGYTFNSVAGAGIGLGAGVYLARRAELSRTRVFVMDLGALVGALAGYLVIGGLIDRDDSSHTDERIRGAAGVIGVGAGAFLAWYYTRGKFAGKRVAVSRDPAPPALVTRGADGRWGWGGLAPAAYGTVDGGSALGVSIVSGRF